MPAAADGNDLNPLLQDPALVIHPPILYAGYVGLAVPFAFAIDRDQEWDSGGDMNVLTNLIVQTRPYPCRKTLAQAGPLTLVPLGLHG